MRAGQGDPRLPAREGEELTDYLVRLRELDEAELSAPEQPLEPMLDLRLPYRDVDEDDVRDFRKVGPPPPKRDPWEERRECGLARAAALSPERRTEIARAAGKARWARRLYRWCRGPCERNFDELPIEERSRRPLNRGGKICRRCERLEWAAEARRRYHRRRWMERVLQVAA